ncbi:hypothetical protein B0H14DRAFT_2654708 [Mycena olivaceomarginata]|nr:hypothetical protein B0H14DRAFT_2654708 [Mycena olivaceomarginata]
MIQIPQRWMKGRKWWVKRFGPPQAASQPDMKPESSISLRGVASASFQSKSSSKDRNTSSKGGGVLTGYRIWQCNCQRFAEVHRGPTSQSRDANMLKKFLALIDDLRVIFKRAWRYVISNSSRKFPGEKEREVLFRGESLMTFVRVSESESSDSDSVVSVVVVRKSDRIQIFSVDAKIKRAAFLCKYAIQAQSLHKDFFLRIRYGIQLESRCKRMK